MPSRLKRISAAMAPIAVVLAIQFGCSPVYTLKVRSDGADEGGTERVESRLRAVLETQGFRDTGLSDAASGETGCGRGAPDRTTFEKECGAPAWGYAWVWVHTFTCEGAWHVVIVSSTGADREAAHLRDELAAAFASEVAAGQMQIETRCRLALE